jgi:beta-galactosidase
MRLNGAEAVATYTDGPLAGVPAVTRNTHGPGTAWYLATLPDPETLTALLHRIRTEAEVPDAGDTPPGVESVRRRGRDADYVFLIDHAGTGAEIPVPPGSTELLTGKPLSGSVRVDPGEIAVVREPRGKDS